MCSQSKIRTPATGYTRAHITTDGSLEYTYRKNVQEADKKLGGKGVFIRFASNVYGCMWQSIQTVFSYYRQGERKSQTCVHFVGMLSPLC